MSLRRRRAALATAIREQAVALIEALRDQDNDKARAAAERLASIAKKVPAILEPS